MCLGGGMSVHMGLCGSVCIHFSYLYTVRALPPSYGGTGGGICQANPGGDSPPGGTHREDQGGSHFIQLTQTPFPFSFNGSRRQFGTAFHVE